MANQIFEPTTGSLFQTQLTLAPRVSLDGNSPVTISMEQTEQWVGLTDANGNRLLTTVFGYGVKDANGATSVSWPGPTLVAQSGVPVTVNWENNLPTTGALVPVDASILMGHGGAVPYQVGPNGTLIGTVVHLHGGHIDAGSDGSATAWYTQNGATVGSGYASSDGMTYTYDNSQQGATLWYHDHAVGITRVNTYSGLSGFYLLQDATESQLISNGVLPDANHQIELAIQDRAFKTDGQLYLPALADDPIPGVPGAVVADNLPVDYTALGGMYPSAVPEFFGNVMMVNGSAWPTHQVEATQYRFNLLNGSDSRVQVIKFSDPNVKLTVVGTDGGLLNKAVTIINGDGVDSPGEVLVLGPGERLDVVADFSNVAGGQVKMLNIGPDFDPFKGFNPDGTLAGGAVALTEADPMGNIMRFDVSAASVPATASVANGDVLNPDYVPPSADDAVRTRKVGLFEVADQYGRIMPTLGNAETETLANGTKVAVGPKAFHDPVTERPQLGTTEVWEVYNATADAHPVHLHLTQYQVLERRSIVFTDANADGVPDDINGDGQVTTGVAGVDDMYVGAQVPLRPEDTGAQDTVLVYPGEMLKLVAKFDKPGEFMWHCHILSHEDHDMMRPFTVVDEWLGMNVVNGNAAQADNIAGTAGKDVLNGFGGDDMLAGGGGADLLNGGEGLDTASYAAAAAGVLANLSNAAGNTGDAAGDVYQGIENLLGSSNNDRLLGDRYDNTLSGGDGNDVLYGAGGNDQIKGGNGTDQVDYDGVAANYSFTRNADGSVTVASAAYGTDTLTGVEDIWMVGENKLYALDQLAPNGGSVINGTAGDDLIDGTAGSDTLNGLGGNDSFYGNIGDDIFDGGAGFDQIDFAGFASDYSFTTNADGSVSVKNATFGNDTLTNVEGFFFWDEQKWYSLEELVASGSGNPINGTAGDDLIDGTKSNDTLSGLGGNDSFYGGTGDDVIDGGTGFDQTDYAGFARDYSFTSNADGSVNVKNATFGNDTLTNVEGFFFWDEQKWYSLEELVAGGGNAVNGTAGNDLMLGTNGADNINGLNGDDTFLALAGSDRLDGGAGYDQADYIGRSSDYSVSKNADGSFSVATSVNPSYGTDILIGIEGMYFYDEGAWYSPEQLAH